MSTTAQPRVAESVDDWRNQLQQHATDRKPEIFALRTQLLTQGRTNLPLAATEKMSVVLKCYAEGGENELHAHPYEDHVFLIMQGQADFYGPNGELASLHRNQGIMLPAGSLYRFEAKGDENLVLLRIGTTVVDGEDPLARIDVEGQPFDGFSEKNRRPKVIYAENSWFE